LENHQDASVAEMAMAIVLLIALMGAVVGLKPVPIYLFRLLTIVAVMAVAQTQKMDTVVNWIVDHPHSVEILYAMERKQYVHAQMIVALPPQTKQCVQITSTMIATEILMLQIRTVQT